jgi:hypothetical protein
MSRRVLVSVLGPGETAERDLEIDSGMPAGDLTAAVRSAFGWDLDEAASQLEIHSTPPGRFLRADETLAQAGAWDGAHLEFTFRTRTFRPAETAVEQPAAGYVWKRLDE